MRRAWSPSAKFGVNELTRMRERFNSLAERLEETTTRNGALLQRVVSVQDEERRRNARELHDNLIQYLFSIRTDTFVINRMLADGRRGEIEGLTRSIVSATNQMEQVIRAMIRRLRPSCSTNSVLRMPCSIWLRVGGPDTACSVNSRSRLGSITWERK